MVEKQLLEHGLESLKNVIADIIRNKDSKIKLLQDTLDKTVENELADILNYNEQDLKRHVILKKKHYKIFDASNIPLLEILMYLPNEKLKDIVNKKQVSTMYKDY